jgi:hypothetical protein
MFFHPPEDSSAAEETDIEDDNDDADDIDDIGNDDDDLFEEEVDAFADGKNDEDDGADAIVEDVVLDDAYIDSLAIEDVGGEGVDQEDEVESEGFEGGAEADDDDTTKDAGGKDTCMTDPGAENGMDGDGLGGLTTAGAAACTQLSGNRPRLSKFWFLPMAQPSPKV